MLDPGLEQTKTKSLVDFENSIEILATSSFTPAKKIPNSYFVERMGIDPEWIKSRTGILERRFVDEGQNTTFLALSAGQLAIKNAKLNPSKIGLVVVATSTADRRTPSTAVAIQHELGMSNAWGFDVSAGCSGFLYALASASSLVNSGAVEYALVIGVECLSKHIDWNDKKSCMLFGDGAGAVVIKKNTETVASPGAHILRSWSDQENDLIIDKDPNDLAATSVLKMNGREVFRQAVSSMSLIVSQLLENLKIDKKDIAHLIVHQANVRILDSVKERLGFSDAQVPGNIDRFGNTGAASIPILLDELAQSGKLKKNDIIVLTAFGAGFTTGAFAYKW